MTKSPPLAVGAEQGEQCILFEAARVVAQRDLAAAGEVLAAGHEVPAQNATPPPRQVEIIDHLEAHGNPRVLRQIHNWSRRRRRRACIRRKLADGDGVCEHQVKGHVLDRLLAGGGEGVAG